MLEHNISLEYMLAVSTHIREIIEKTPQIHDGQIPAYAVPSGWKKDERIGSDDEMYIGQLKDMHLIVLRNIVERIINENHVASLTTDE